MVVSPINSVQVFFLLVINSDKASTSLLMAVDDPLQKFQKMGRIRLFFTLAICIKDSDLLTLSPSIDTYIYLTFLRMSLWFFSILTLINGLFVVPIYSTGLAQVKSYQTVLPHIQRITIANVIGDDSRINASFIVGCVNWLLLCLFIMLFKRKIDLTNKNALNKYDDNEVRMAGQTLMV